MQVLRVIDDENTEEQLAEYWYDLAGRKYYVNELDRGENHFTFDAAGNLRRIEDANHDTTEHCYDALNRVVLSKYTDHDSPETTTPVVSIYDEIDDPNRSLDAWKDLFEQKWCGEWGNTAHNQVVVCPVSESATDCLSANVYNPQTGTCAATYATGSRCDRVGQLDQGYCGENGNCVDCLELAHCEERACNTRLCMGNNCEYKADATKNARLCVISGDTVCGSSASQCLCDQGACRPRKCALCKHHACVDGPNAGEYCETENDEACCEDAPIN